MEVWEIKHKEAWGIYIDPLFDPKNTRRGRLPLVSIHSRKEFYFEVKDIAWERAQVNWSAIGLSSPETAEVLSRALKVAAEHARKMDEEHGFATTPPSEIVVTVELCSWCLGTPISVKGAEKVPPGTHDVKMKISHGICSSCGVKFSTGIKAKEGVSSKDTVESNTSVDGKRS